MEASALHAPSLTRVPLGAPLLRLRSDEQLLALFRAGNEDAFGAIHDRYRQRLFAYVRQHLAPHKTPSRWFAVEEYPMTGSGKIQKFQLREQAKQL